MSSRDIIQFDLFYDSVCQMALVVRLQQALEKLLNYHFARDDKTGETPYHRSVRNFAPELAKKCKLFGRVEVERTLSKMNRGNAPGPDDLPLEIIEEVYFTNKPLFVRLLNSVEEE